MRTYMIILLIVAVLSIAVIGAALGAPGTVLRSIESGTTPARTPTVSAETLKLVGAIRNTDVAWGPSYFGMIPNELHGATSLLLHNEEDITPLLVDALVDQDRFVAAHVLLGLRQQMRVGAALDAYRERGLPLPTLAVEPRATKSQFEWFGLDLHLSADNRVSFEGYDLADLQTLQNKWKEWLGR